MHREDNSKFLLYIEPKSEQKSDEPVNDEITKIVQDCLDKAQKGTATYSKLDCEELFVPNSGYKGFHTTDCGEKSSNIDYLLGNGMITNSLCTFYLQYYRDVIPKSEMNKVMQLCQWAKSNMK